jgi:hypothetical protein
VDVAMNTPAQTNPPIGSGRPAVTQVTHSIALVPFVHRPFAKRLITIYSPMLTVGYPAILSSLIWLNRSWGMWWIDVWRPVVDFLSPRIPVFDRSLNALVARDLAPRVAITHHVLAFEWVVLMTTLLVLIGVILSVPRQDWVRMATTVSRPRLALLLVGSPILFSISAYYAYAGLPVTSNPLYAWHVDGWGLVVIGIIFQGVMLFAVATLVAVRGMIVARQLDDIHENSP